MSVTEILALARRQQVELFVEGDALRYRAYGTPLSAELRQRLTVEKAAIIAFLRDHKQALPVRRADLDDAPAVLTQAQQRMYFLHQAEGDGSQCNMAFAFDIEGQIAEERLETAIRAVIQRHAVLRTVYDNRDGALCQIQRPASDFRLVLSAAATAEEAEEVVRQQSAASFSLRTDLPLRVTLIRFAPGRSKLSLVFHHIAFDGWSYQLFLSELSMEMAGHIPPVPPFQIADIARQQDQAATDAAKLGYWQNRLSGAEPLNGLSPDRARSGGAEYTPASCTTRLDHILTRDLAAAAQQNGITVFEFLQASFGAVVARWTGRTHAIIGTPVAGRGHPAFDRMIGLFVNTLPVRIDIPPANSLSDFLILSAERFRADLVHQDVPFDAIVAAVIATRDPSYPPLVQIFFAMNEAEEDHLSIPGVKAVARLAPRTTVNFELELHVTLTPEGAELDWHFAENLFDQATIRLLAESYEAFLRDALARPDAPVGQLTVVSDSDLSRLEAWSGALVAPMASKDFSERFSDWARATPGRVACFDDSTQWSYAELDTRSRHVAAALQASGVHAGDLVGLAVDRNLSMILGILAILRAGAAYVPLDGKLPDARLLQVLEDARPVRILGDQAAPDVVRDERFIDIETAMSCNLEIDPVSYDPEGTAYVIFTSGTTGQPKGVVVNRRNLSNFLSGAATCTPLPQGAVIPLMTSVSFDVHVVETLHALASGATVAVPGEDRLAAPTALCRFFNDSLVTDIHATPAAWRMLLDAGWRGDAGMRLYSGGDALPERLKIELQEAGGGAPLWNYYGPTEATVYVSAARMAADDGVHIGHPMPGNNFHILSPSLMPLPPGIVGQLFLSGANLAQGYLNRPDLTEARFVTCPRTGVRLYDTGDLAKWRPDGTVALLGRSDFQVKIRGHRIELSEIEGLLGRQSDVTDAVAAAAPDGMTLSAFICPRLPAARIEALRGLLAAQLPPYMVPSQILALEKLPVTPNGKIDRAALMRVHQPADIELTPPQTEEELLIARIWQDILATETIDIFASFFALGGHSLLAVRMLAQLEAQTGAAISLRQMLMAPTVSGLARLIGQTKPHQNDDAGEILL